MIFAWTYDFDLQLAFRNNILEFEKSREEFEMPVFHCVLGRIVFSLEVLVKFTGDFLIVKRRAGAFLQLDNNYGVKNSQSGGLPSAS